jgi:UDP-N-acetylglucosamine 2-epimerase (non-hydrolysing)
VDHRERLSDIIQMLEKALGECKVIFPVHPRTRGNMEKFGIRPARIIMVEPLSYFEFMYLVKQAKGVITDSGGITEETTVLGIPCITMRNTTERPETCDIGTNELVGTDLNDLKRAIEKLLNGKWKKGSIPELWDGKTAQRIVERFLELSI